MPTNTVTRVAGILVVLEGILLAALAAWQVAALVGGDTTWIDSALALIVLTAVGAAAVIAFGVGAYRGLSWGRSGGVVTQALILAVALGAATGAYAHPLIGLAIAVPAIVVLVLLILAARAAGAAASSESRD